MRVLLASPGLALGGAERVVVSLAHGLRERGYDVAISGAAGPLDAEVEGLERLYLPERGRSPLGVAEWVAREAAFVRSWRPHVIHAHNTRATVVAALAARLARGPRRPPLLATHHGSYAADRTAAARLLARAADEVVAVADDLLPGLRPRVIANGIDPAPPGDGPRAGVLTVARLEPSKNPQRLLDVARRLPEVRFTVVGDGSLRAALDPPPNVALLGARDDARRLMASAELLLVTSDWEGHSIAVLEALAAGTPVVSTPVSGLRGLDGVRIAAGFDPGDVAAAVRDLLADAAARERMGAAGAALIRERFSADAMVDAYAQRYQALTIPH